MPGITEKEAGRPFNAGSGTRLFKWLTQAGIDEGWFRQSQYMTAVTKCYPGRAKSGSGDRVPSRKEQELCRPYLQAEISLIAFILVLISVIMAKSYFGKGHPLSGGMPSGHSALAFSAWVSVTYITESFPISLLCLFLAVAVAQSRVAVKVHRPLEVLFGALLGATLTFLLFRFFS